MKLSRYLAEAGISTLQFAARIGRSREAVRRYCSGARIPDRATMALIVGATGGVVQPNDFFDLPGFGRAPRIATAARRAG